MKLRMTTVGKKKIKRTELKSIGSYRSFLSDRLGHQVAARAGSMRVVASHHFSKKPINTRLEVYHIPETNVKKRVAPLAFACRSVVYCLI